MNTFADLGLTDEILKAIGELGFEVPTPIQNESIPYLLNSDQDIIGLAQTGTGKTAAFGLPAIQKTNLNSKDTQTLILCPTRELCLQITADLTQYAKYVKGIGIVPVYGGSSIDKQVKALKKNGQIVVATPGRAKDLINRKRLKLHSVTTVILDEADEMLTMGFKEELDAILSETPDEKQTLLYSATISKEIKRISKKYMTDPIELAVAQENIGAENVSHEFYMVHARDKYEVVKRIADVNPEIYAIIFCRTRRDTTEIANRLISNGYNAGAIHGDLSQAQRDEVMGRFKSKRLQLLVATDVAARGVDVKDLTHVINYSLPDSSEIYTHRSGRTGRAGKSGISVAIIHSRETRKLKDIQRRSDINFEQKAVPTGKEICKIQLFTLLDKIENIQVNEEQIAPFLPEVYEKLEWLSKEQLIRHVVSAEFNRFISDYKNARDINIYDGGKGSRSKDDRRSSKRKDDRYDRDRSGRDNDRRNDRRSSYRDSDRSRFTRLFINAGTKQKLNPGWLIGMINTSLSPAEPEIGKIEILKKFSFIEVQNDMADDVIDRFSGKHIGGVEVKLEKASSRPEFAKEDRANAWKGRKSKKKGHKKKKRF